MKSELRLKPDGPSLFPLKPPDLLIRVDPVPLVFDGNDEFPAPTLWVRENLAAFKGDSAFIVAEIRKSGPCDDLGRLKPQGGSLLISNFQSLGDRGEPRHLGIKIEGGRALPTLGKFFRRLALFERPTCGVVAISFWGYRHGENYANQN